jgi:hypothetical protein
MLQYILVSLSAAFWQRVAIRTSLLNAPVSWNWKDAKPWDKILSPFWGRLILIVAGRIRDYGWSARFHSLQRSYPCSASFLAMLFLMGADREPFFSGTVRIQQTADITSSPRDPTALSVTPAMPAGCGRTSPFRCF